MIVVKPYLEKTVKTRQLQCVYVGSERNLFRIIYYLLTFPYAELQLMIISVTN